jgi:hypothetical protein
MRVESVLCSITLAACSWERWRASLARQVMLPEETFLRGADRIQVAMDSVRRAVATSGGGGGSGSGGRASARCERAATAAVATAAKCNREGTVATIKPAQPVTPLDLIRARGGVLPPPLMRRCLAWLQGDVAALAAASATCREWRATAHFVLGHIYRADLSALGARTSIAALQACRQRVGVAIGGVRCDCPRLPPHPLLDPSHAYPCSTGRRDENRCWKERQSGCTMTRGAVGCAAC